MNYEPLNYKYIKHNNLIILESIFTLYGNLKQLFIVPPVTSYHSLTID